MKSIRKMIIGLAVMLLGVGIEGIGLLGARTPLIIGGVVIIIGLFIVIGNNDGTGDHNE